MAFVRLDHSFLKTQKLRKFWFHADSYCKLGSRVVLYISFCVYIYIYVELAIGLPIFQLYTPPSIFNPRMIGKLSHSFFHTVISFIHKMKKVVSSNYKSDGVMPLVDFILWYH